MPTLLLNASPSSRLIAWSMALTLGLFSLISMTAPSCVISTCAARVVLAFRHALRCTWSGERRHYFLDEQLHGPLLLLHAEAQARVVR